MADKDILPIGKLPHRFLKKIVYKKLGKQRDDIVLGPGIGVDSAILYTSNEKYVYVTTDPITASKELIGTLCVYVATNDLVSTGALPKWILINALLNKNLTVAELNRIFDDIDRACKKIGASVVGGHTEVTPYLDRPILISTAIGTSNRKFNKKPEPGDLIIMTKSVGIEGTVILCYEYKDLLLDKGVPLSLINKGKRLIDSISVVPEAKILFNEIYDQIIAIHDPTEGGIYTALNEMLTFLGMGADIYGDNIMVFPEIIELSSYLNINPFFFLSSGCIIVAIKREYADHALDKLKSHNIQVSIIGELKERSHGKKLITHGKVKTLPVKVKDEIWKLF